LGSGGSIVRTMLAGTKPSSTPQVHSPDRSVWMLRMVFGESLICPRGAAAVRLAKVVVAQPGPCGEVDQLVARDRRGNRLGVWRRSCDNCGGCWGSCRWRLRSIAYQPVARLTECCSFSSVRSPLWAAIPTVKVLCITSGLNTDNRRLRFFDPESDQKPRNRVVCGGEDFLTRDLTGSHFDYL
jgi:hypothetical protein